MSRKSGILILSYRLKEVTNSYVFSLFLNFKECLYPCNQMSDWEGVWIKMQHFKWTRDFCWKSKLNIADMWLIPLDRVTHWVLKTAFLCLWFLLQETCMSQKMFLDHKTLKKQQKITYTNFVHWKIEGLLFLKYVIHKFNLWIWPGGISYSKISLVKKITC